MFLFSGWQVIKPAEPKAIQRVCCSRDCAHERHSTLHTRGSAGTAILESVTAIAFQFRGKGKKNWHNEKRTRSMGIFEGILNGLEMGFLSF